MKKATLNIIKISLVLIGSLAYASCYSDTLLEAQTKMDALADKIHANKSQGSFYRKEGATEEMLRKSISSFEEGKKILVSPELQKLVYTGFVTESKILTFEIELACLYARLGEKEKALDELESYAKRRLLSGDVKYLQQYPELSILKNEPRFIRLIEQMRMPGKIGKASVINTPYKPQLSLEERIAGLSLYWAEVRKSFVYFDHIPDVDWDKAYLEFLAKVVDAKTTEEYYRVMMQLAPLLRDGHTNIYPPEELMDVFFARPPLRTEKLGGKVLITSVRNKKLKERIFIGDEILEVDGIPVNDYAENHVAPFVSSSTVQDREVRLYSYQLLAGNVSKPVRLTLRDAAGKERIEQVGRDLVTDASGHKAFEFRMLPGNIAFLVLDHFESNQAGTVMQKILPQLLQAKGLVLDVRNNGGGSSNHGLEVLSYLSDQAIPVSRSTVRSESGIFLNNDDIIYFNGLYPHLNSYKEEHPEVFKGPVAVLAGPKTFSAAEDFLVSFDLMKRGIIVGRPSGGSTGQPVVVKLPGGGSGRVCAKRDFYPDGREFVGKGVVPDIEVIPTVEDVRAGKDVVLERALQAITNNEKMPRRNKADSLS